jgi:hypothetical protein
VVEKRGACLRSSVHTKWTWCAPTLESPLFHEETKSRNSSFSSCQVRRACMKNNVRSAPKNIKRSKMLIGRFIKILEFRPSGTLTRCALGVSLRSSMNHTPRTRLTVAKMPIKQAPSLPAHRAYHREERKAPLRERACAMHTDRAPCPLRC